MSTHLARCQLRVALRSRVNARQLLPFSLQFNQGTNSSHSRHTYSSLATPTAIGISEIWSGLWDSILKAVPKKKTSHSKKRSRQLAGKALKDVKSLNHCSGCGRVKRMHFLCPHCVQNIKDIWAGRTAVPKKIKPT